MYDKSNTELAEVLRHYGKDFQAFKIKWQGVDYHISKIVYKQSKGTPANNFCVLEATDGLAVFEIATHQPWPKFV